MDKNQNSIQIYTQCNRKLKCNIRNTEEDMKKRGRGKQKREK
jgi:hypothetical protein